VKLESRITIRPASADEGDAIARVHIASWQRAYEHVFPAAFLAALSLEQRRCIWAESIATGHPQLFVADVDSQIAGFAAVGRCRDESAPTSAFEIWAIYVLPSHWSTGLGRELWLASLDWALARGATEVSLWVVATNQRAIAFYKLAGFEADSGSLRSFALGGVQVEELRFAQRVAGCPAGHSPGDDRVFAARLP
jgi:GNAT superfamily N-acetyltransferase